MRLGTQVIKVGRQGGSSPDTLTRTFLDTLGVATGEQYVDTWEYRNRLTEVRIKDAAADSAYIQEKGPGPFSFLAPFRSRTGWRVWQIRTVTPSFRLIRLALQYPDAIEAGSALNP
jgi:hypothetical protein